MNKLDKDRIVTLYEDRYKQYGYGSATIGWHDRAQQVLRFKMLTDPFDLRGKSVCDVGCGFGDMLPYLKKRSRGVRYTGIDIAPSLIDEAARRYPSGEFIVRDILSEKFNRRFDYMFLSGALNYRISDNRRFARRMIKKMFEMSREGISFNMLSKYVDYEKKMNFHYSPEEFFGYAKSLSRFVSLRHDYPLWEFTIHILKYEPKAI